MSTTKPPEKIYGWLNTQLSVARYYGGCTYDGHPYRIDMQDPDRPLVRVDVLTAEAKARKVADKAEKAQAITRDFFEDGVKA
jgi:hypothetical protein